MTLRIGVLAGLILLTFNEGAAQSGSASQGVIIDVRVFEVARATPDELDRIASDQAALRSFLASDRVDLYFGTRFIASPGQRTSMGVSDRVPIISPDGGPSAQYREISVGLTTTARVFGERINMNLQINLNLVDPGARVSNPIFVVRSLNNTFDLKSGETVMLLGLVRNDPLIASSRAQASGASASTIQGNFVIVATAKLGDR